LFSLDVAILARPPMRIASPRFMATVLRIGSRPSDLGWLGARLISTRAFAAKH
jgi:hypothetical protein